MKYNQTLFKMTDALCIILEYDQTKKYYRCYDVTRNSWFHKTELSLDYMFEKKYWNIIS